MRQDRPWIFGFLLVVGLLWTGPILAQEKQDEGEKKKQEEEAKEKIKVFKQDVAKALRTNNEDGVIDALRALGEMQHDKILPEITNYLKYGNKDAGASVRREAARQMGKYLKSQKAAETLLGAAKMESDEEAAALFVESAGETRCRALAKKFVDLFEFRKLTVATAAIDACGKLKARATIDPLINLLKEMDRISDDPNAPGDPKVPGGGSGGSHQETERRERKQKISQAIKAALYEILGWKFDKGVEWEKEWRKKGAQWKEPEE